MGSKGEYIEKAPHYNRGEIECIDYIEDKGLGFHLGNVVKYIERAGHKETTDKIDDLRKAAWYLDRYICLHTTKQEEPKGDSDFSACTEDID